MGAALIRAYDNHAQWLSRAQIGDAASFDVASVHAEDPVADRGGRCQLCSTQTHFVSPDNLREGLNCAACHANARQRAAVIVLRDAGIDCASTIYVTEQVGPFYRTLRTAFPNARGSEFLSHWKQRLRLQLWLWRRHMREWLRHEDATALRWRDAMFDAVLCQDVLEHVDDHQAALREFARVLKPKGCLILTVPFYDDAAHSVRIAELDSQGNLYWIGAPEYHGDPRGGGVPCLHHFGWDLLDAMRDAGFSSAQALRVHDPDNGVPMPLWVLRAMR